MDKKSLLKFRTAEPELYDKLCKISINFRKLNALFRCLDLQLSEKEIFSDKETDYLFDVIKAVMSETLTEFEQIEDAFNL